MKIICFKEGKENRAVLLDGNRFADWASKKYNTEVSVEFRKSEEMYYDKHSYYFRLYAIK